MGLRNLRPHLFPAPIQEVPLAVGIKVRDKESIDRALRRFKRAVNRSRVLRIYRDNMAFTKPSEKTKAPAPDRGAGAQKRPGAARAARGRRPA